MKASPSNISLHLEDVSWTAPVKDVSKGELPATDSPQDPQNWPQWKKDAQILMVAFHSMMCTFMAAGIVSAYHSLAHGYQVTVPAASYLTSVQVCGVYHRRFWRASTDPVILDIDSIARSLSSALEPGDCGVWTLPSHSVLCLRQHALQHWRRPVHDLRCAGATRALTAFLISPPIGNGSGVVNELCQPEKRAQKLGWWTLMTTVGTPFGRFLMGFVIERVGCQWIFWIFAIVNFCQFLLYPAIGDETIYNPANERQGNGLLAKILPRRITSRSLKLHDFVAPFSLALTPRVLIAACAHAITFCYGNIAIIVEMSIAFGEKFHFNAQQIGLQFVAIIIGCVLGEQVSSPMSDCFMKWMRQNKGHSRPADRLWISHFAFSTVFAGLLTWGFQLQHAETWNVTPCVGGAIANFGNQMLTTILTTFAVESKKERLLRSESSSTSVVKYMVL